MMLRRRFAASLRLNKFSQKLVVISPEHGKRVGWRALAAGTTHGDSSSPQRPTTRSRRLRCGLQTLYRCGRREQQQIGYRGRHQRRQTNKGSSSGQTGSIKGHLAAAQGHVPEGESLPPRWLRRRSAACPHPPVDPRRQRVRPPCFPANLHAVCWPLAAQRARVYSPRAAPSLPPPPCHPPQNLGRSTHGTRACCSPQLRFVNAWHPSARLLPPILRPPFDFDLLSLSQRRRQRAWRLNRRGLRHDRHAKRRAPRDFGPLGPRHLWAGPQGAHAGRFRLRVEGDPESAGLPAAGGDGGRAGTLAHRVHMLLR